MSIWIITTGSSDVQLNTKERWTKLFRNVRSQLDDRGFIPTEGTDNRFLAPARVMGTVYSQTQAKEYWDDLAFPLLHHFVGQLHNERIDQIILILTDQTAVFSSEKRRSQHHPYWQDTCTLQPILETYLKDKFPQAELKPLLLQPESSEGLDDWNSVLTLIQGKFSKLDFPGESTIYVSHQAGTPAISSAVQFEILLRFGQRVNFLVSSERDSKLTKILDRSTYLKGIRKQEAKALLERHDYSGVKELLESYLEPETKILLEAAIQWNQAEFKKFTDELKNCANQNFKKEVQERTEEKNWWWSAYESAYLAVVRLKQNNTVEAIFHSFRAVEGLLWNWIEKDYSAQWINGRLVICSKEGKPIKNSQGKNFNAYGKHFYYFLDSERNIKQEEKDHKDILIFGKYIFDRRNDLFHKLKGLQDKKAVFEFWEISKSDKHEDQDKLEQRWKNRVLNCLNFIADPKPRPTSLKEASLMSKVHQELEKAIM